jgi:outer membrane autotransporter protein
MAVNGLYKLGAGRLTLSGANTYRGNSALLQGSLLLAHDQALGGPANMLDANIGSRLEYADGIVVRHGLQVQAIDLANLVPAHWWAPIPPGEDPGALQWSVDRGEATHLGSLFGNAPIVKVGQGTLRFAGMGMIYGGNLTVREGALRVDSMLAGQTRIEAGAQLLGVGALASAWVGGTVSPAGEGIGTLTIQGKLDFAPGSHTRMHLMADGQGDRIQVGGAAELAGHVDIQALPGAWRDGTQYTLLQANGGLAGSRFDSVAGNLDFLNPVLSYEPDRVLLTMLRNDTGLEACATTPQGRGAGRAIDRDVQALEDRLVGGSCADARRALESMAHVGAASLRSALIEDSRHVRQAALAHAGSGRVWTQSWFSNADRAKAMGPYGNQWADSRDTSGLLIGVDRGMAPGWHLGGFAGMQHMDFTTQGVPSGMGGLRARSLSVHGGATLAAMGEDGALILGAAHGVYRSRSLRRAGQEIGLADERLRATQHAGGTQAWVEWRIRPAATQRWSVQPWLQLAWVRLDSRAYDEQGGLAALHVRGALDQRVFSTVGLQAARTVPAPHGMATLQARLGWHAMTGARDLVSTQSFRAGGRGETIEAGGQPLARHVLQLDIGVDAPIAPGVRLGMGYTGQYQEGGPQHGAVLSLAVKW